MKKLLAIILTIITLFSACTVFASDTKKETTNIVNIGYVTGYGGIRNITSVAKKGYLYDFFSRLSIFCDYAFEFIEYPDFDTLIKAFDNGEIQYFGPVLKTTNSSQNFDYSLRLSDALISLVSPPDKNTIYYDDPKSINGKTVASYKDSILEDYLNAYCQKNNISVDYIRGTTSNYHELNADYYLISSLEYKFFDYPSAVNLAVFPLYMATTPENLPFKEEINSAYNEMLSCDIDFLYKLHQKYYDNSTLQRRTLTREESELLQNNTLKVAFETGHKFFSYLNDKGEPDGLLVDLFNYIMLINGVTVEFIPYSESIPYTTNEKGVYSVEYVVQNADIVLSSLGKFKNYKDKFTLTDTYIEVPFTVIVDKELYYPTSNTTEAKIGIVRNMYMEPSATTGLPFNKKFIIYDDMDLLYQDFNNDKIDGFFIEESATYVARENVKREFFTYASDAVTPYKLWISNKLGQEYITIANVILDNIHPGKLNEFILLEQAKYKEAPNLAETLKANLPLIIICVILIILGILLLIIFMQKNKQKEIKELLEVDALTGLMSKYKFINELQISLKTAKPKEYLMLALDIDNFKHFNKVYGNKKADQLLCAIGSVLKENSDSFIYICRLQNDNFITLLRNRHTTWSSVKQLKEYNKDFEKNVKDNLTEKIISLGIDTPIYFSVGIYPIIDPTENIPYIIDCTLTAKNYAKRNFGNSAEIFTEEIRKKQKLENEIIFFMESAVKNKEFFILVQPKVELETGKLVGGEVLVRWKKSDGSFIYPDEFIPLFEKNNFIRTLDYYVLERTCEFISSTTIELPIISINVSISTMLEKDFISKYMLVLEKYSIVPKQLEIELTESVLDFNYLEIIKIIKELKKLGFSIAIDDFGKGASSLARIKEVDMDILKLDKVFIDDNATNEKGKIVLQNIVSLAHALGAKSLAEGVETKVQQEMLIKLGCELAQGYYFDKPLSTEDFLKKAKANQTIFTNS